MPIRRQFGVAKAHRHLMSRGTLEQRLGHHVRHLALKPAIDLGLILQVPAREERGERQFRIDDQIGAPGFRFIHQRDHAPDDRFAAVGFLDRAHLGGSDIDDTHGSLPECIDLRLYKARPVRISRPSEDILAQPESTIRASVRSESIPKRDRGGARLICVRPSRSSATGTLSGNDDGQTVSPVIRVRQGADEPFPRRRRMLAADRHRRGRM